MKKSTLLLFFIAAALPCHAQWQTTIFQAAPQVLAFGVHDTSFFCSIAPPDNTYRVLYRYVPTRGWTRSNSGIDSSQGNITSFASLGTYFFAGGGPTNTGAAYRSTDNGLNWKDVIGGPVGTNGTYVFAQYGTRIARSRDSGAHWEHLSPPAGTCYTGVSGTYVLCATPANGLYHSTDSGGTWSPVTTPISNTSVFAVVGTVIYAANGTQLMKSTDSGATWELVSTNFSVSSLATDSTHLFAGGSSGVYLLGSDGTTWTAESDTGVVALGVFDTLLFADFEIKKFIGGSWVSSYFLDFRSIPEMMAKSGVIAAQQPEDTLSIYPNPATEAVTIFSGGTSIQDVRVLNVLGYETGSGFRGPASANVELDLSKLPSGTYFLEIQNADGSRLRKITIER